MTQALVRVAGTLWPQEETDVSLNALINLVNACPGQLERWQESAVLEGARSVLSRLNMLQPVIDTMEVTTTIPPDVQPGDFFEKVAVLARRLPQAAT